MPELPEVETTRRGIEPHLVDQRIAKIKEAKKLDIAKRKEAYKKELIGCWL